MKERRRYKRFGVTLPAILRHNGRLFPAETVNVSEGGFCLRLEAESPAEIQPGKKAEVILDLSEGKRDISLIGEVVHTNAGGKNLVGIKILEFYTPSHEILTNFISQIEGGQKMER